MQIIRFESVCSGNRLSEIVYCSTTLNILHTNIVLYIYYAVHDCIGAYNSYVLCATHKTFSVKNERERKSRERKKTDYDLTSTVCHSLTQTLWQIKIAILPTNQTTPKREEEGDSGRPTEWGFHGIQHCIHSLPPRIHNHLWFNRYACEYTFLSHISVLDRVEMDLVDKVIDAACKSNRENRLFSRKNRGDDNGSSRSVNGIRKQTNKPNQTTRESERIKNKNAN